MKYTKARELIAEALEQLNERQDSGVSREVLQHFERYLTQTPNVLGMDGIPPRGWTPSLTGRGSYQAIMPENPMDRLRRFGKPWIEPKERIRHVDPFYRDMMTLPRRKKKTVDESTATGDQWWKDPPPAPPEVGGGTNSPGLQQMRRRGLRALGSELERQYLPGGWNGRGIFDRNPWFDKTGRPNLGRVLDREWGRIGSAIEPFVRERYADPVTGPSNWRRDQEALRKRN